LRLLLPSLVLELLCVPAELLDEPNAELEAPDELLEEPKELLEEPKVVLGLVIVTLLPPKLLLEVLGTLLNPPALGADRTAAR